ncbi:nuclease-like protein [Planomicrobium soli]|uniref:Nuclease-like protein n=1 Tax=Planomicrobium soli TaxID=1176648 RepID=A0A2P8GR11_9BACL|nr:nuclease-like protein [Planomicrobium soli]
MGRLESDHPQREFLKRKLHWTMAGTRGESRLQKEFKEFYLEDEFHILWNVNLKIGTWPVQMDGLLLTSHGAIIIESKNINGQLYFNKETDEFFRLTIEGEKTILEDPRIQMNKHIRFLKQFFKINNIRLPIAGLIVFTAKECEFLSKPPDTAICKTYQMVEYLLKILLAFPPESPNLNLLKIKRMILANQAPYKHPPLCVHFFIDSKDLKPGVYCRSCKELTMQRNKRNWECSKCGARDESAHILAIREYLTFVERHLTNQKLRSFCGVESRAVATRLLGRTDLKRIGESKAYSYHMPE